MSVYYIKEFLNNPAGKGSTVLNINATKQQFSQRYSNIVKKIHQAVYFIDSDIYFHIGIPSSVEGIHYDVVVKFSPTKSSTGTSINDMSMEIFSNSPSFLYTYAHAYEKEGLFIREFKKKLSSKMLKDVAEVKNPYNVLSYDFSVYAALTYITVNGYTIISDLSRIALKEPFKVLFNRVQDAEDLQTKRSFQKKANTELAKESEKQKKKFKSSGDIATDAQKAIKSVSKTKSVKSNKEIKGAIHVTRIKKK